MPTLIGIKRWIRNYRHQIYLFISLFLVLIYIFDGFEFFAKKTAIFVNVVNFSQAKKLKKFGLNSSNSSCVIPKLEPFIPEIVNLKKKSVSIKCDGPKDWVFVDDNLILQWTEYAKKNEEISSIRCTLSYILRKDDDNQEFKEMDNVEIGKFQVEKDFFLLSCRAGFLRTWKKLFMVLVPKKAPENLPNVGNKMNVVVIGADSVSHMEFIRSLPETYNYLQNVMGSVILNGYNIVGDGTPQAFLPILTGQTEVELPLTRKRFKNASFVNVYPFVWKDFAKAGYATGYGEDQKEIDMFNYRLKGFKEQPTDHYLRPFMAEIYKMFKNERDCNGENASIAEWFKYIEEFLSRYKNRPVFGVFHHNQLTHDADHAHRLDPFLHDFLRRNNEAGRFENTVLIIMADHGARFTALRQTSQGQLEERMPFFSVYLPEKLRNHPSFENLKENADRLTTPFDIHSTFLDLLNISEIPEEDFTKEPLGPLKRSLSLLRPIPANRTCKDANVEPHWCSCVAWRPIKNSSHLQNLGKNIVEKIVSVFNGFLKEEPGLCATLKLAKIEKMERLAPDDGVLTYNGVKDADGFDPKFKQDKIIKDFVTYRLSFWTEPGMAHYEVTVEYNEATKELKMDPQAISHVNKYGDLPHCVIKKNYFLGNFCVCKDMIPKLSKKPN